MVATRTAVFFALFAGAFAASQDATPISKVISLIEDMKKEVEDDGKTEAAAYDKFACFCKSTSDKKSTSVKNGNDKIGVLSADIADKTQEQKDDSSELRKRQGDHEALNKKLADTISRHAKDKAEYEAEAADLSKAIQGLKDAIGSMTDSKPSLLEIRSKLGNTLDIAAAMNIALSPKHKSVAAFLQQSATVDPSDPEYKFHSQEIIDLCKELLGEYKANKKDLDTEWGKTDKAAKEMKKSLNSKLDANKKAMDNLKKNIAKLAKEIAQHRTDLITAEGQMKDDEQYLNELTKRCQDRANDYDQRSAMRDDEITALSTALDILNNGVKKAANTVNKRALLIQTSKPSVSQPAPVATKAIAKAISFLQGASSNAAVREQKKGNALEVLRKAGQRLGSLSLMSLADQAAADPFKKVKGLIQKLIERLLAESQAEASKKGFCDTELGKARKDRDYRFQEADDLSAELSSLQAKRDELKQEIKELTKDIKEETTALKDTTEERDDEKKANLKTLATAKDGLAAVNEAILTLRTFYKQAAKAAFVQASPLDEDTKGAGFEGNYKGNQNGSKAIFALLETIASDFDRTLRKTEEAEHQAHRDYVDFSQTAQASIAGKTTKKDLDEQDLKTTLDSIASKTEDMQTAVDLMDNALKELEKLTPTCIDTGMSYKERVAKREEEMDALKKALCILDEEKVEAECQ